MLGAQVARVALNLHLFDETPTMTTGTNSLSTEMKIFYSDYLIDIATPLLVHDRWGQKRPIPKNKGKTVEFRRYSPLEKALTPLVEGVTPKGNSLEVTDIEATVYQYGDWIRLSDMLLLTAIDNNMVEAIDLLGDQAGRTLDTITREVLNGGKNVMYAPAGDDEVLVRHALTPACKMTVDLSMRGVASLKTMLAKPAEGNYYIQIIHPQQAYDIMRDRDWVEARVYGKQEDIYAGEIGRQGQVRYIESTESKVYRGADLASDARELKLASAAEATDTVIFEGGSVEAKALVGREVLINGYKYKVVENSVNSLKLVTVSESIETAASITAAKGTLIYPGEGGAEGVSVFTSLLLGKNAYGVTNITGGGLEHIVHQLGSGGTSDPLNQRATAGWKATKAAVRLVEEYMIRFETSATQYKVPAN